MATGQPLAAICGATVALAHAGLLDDHAHTSNSLKFLRDNAPAYGGGAHYREATVVSEGGIVTAPGSSPVGFACECLRVRSEEHTSELQSLMHISYAVLCLKQKTTKRK